MLSIWKGYILGCYQLLEFENLKDLSDPTLELFLVFPSWKGHKKDFRSVLVNYICQVWVTSHPGNILELGLRYMNINLAGGFKYFLFSSLPGEMIKFD